MLKDKNCKFNCNSSKQLADHLDDVKYYVRNTKHAGRKNVNLQNVFELKL